MEKWLTLFRLLTDETRMRIMVALSARPLCVCELADLLDVSQPKVSKHLAKLRDLGYVEGQRHEKYILYRLHFPGKSEEVLFQALMQHRQTSAVLDDLFHKAQALAPVWATRPPMDNAFDAAGKDR